MVVADAGIGIGTVWTNSDTLVGTLVDRRQLGASMGAAQSFKEFGDMVGPLLIGPLTGSVSTLAMFAAGSVARRRAGRCSLLDAKLPISVAIAAPGVCDSTRYEERHRSRH